VASTTSSVVPSTATVTGDVKKEPGMPATGDSEDSAATRLTGYQRILNIMSTKQVSVSMMIMLMSLT